MPKFHSLTRFVLPLVVLAVVGGCSDGDGGDDGTAPVFLTEVGIGDLEVGDPFDLVSDDLLLLFGGPDVDSADPTARVYVPDCGGEMTRLQAWGNFIVMYTGPPGDLRLASWTYGFDPLTGSGDDTRNLDLTTDELIGLGSTRAEIRDAYGARASFTDAPALDSVLVDIGNTATSHITGRLEPDVVLLELAPTCK